MDVERRGGRRHGMAGGGWLGSWMGGVGLLALLWAVSGCDPGGGGGSSGEARYPLLKPSGETGVAPVSVVAPGHSNLVGAMRRFSPIQSPILSGIETELSPGTLWHSTADQVFLFSDLAKIGLGAPAFLAYSSPTGIATVRPGGVMTGDQMRENWVLAAFPGAVGWTNWDSPWAVFFQNRPRHVALETNTVTIAFDGPAGYWTMMPLYGTYLPPQQGREVLKAQGLKEKGLLTWEWPLVVARDPLTRLRYWAGATRRFPIRAGGDVLIRGKQGTVTLRETFEWFDMPDAWSTRAVEVAPISPGLGLVLTRGQSFPVEFSKAPFDFEMPTVYGPWFGVPGVSSYTMAFRVLRYVNEAERVVPTGGRGGSATTSAAMERLRQAGRELFASVEGYRPQGGADWVSKEALRGYLWQARALEFFDDSIRSNALVCLRRAMWERVLAPERFVERLAKNPDGGVMRFPEGNGLADKEWASALLQAVWAVAHATGDRDGVRQRWPLLQRAGQRLGHTSWVGFGRGETSTLGDGAAPALAWARLAWLAGDVESYRDGCGAVARELALLYGRLRGGTWFREHQPWRPGPLMPETVAPQRLVGGTGGWAVSGPGYASVEGENWPGDRWVRFVDWDVARFCRDHVLAEVRREVAEMEKVVGAAGRSTSGWVGLHEMGFAATGSESRLSLEDPALPEGDLSAVLARCLAMLKAEGLVRSERLIPAVDLEGPEVPGQGEPWSSHLIQTLDLGPGNPVQWPRLRWVNWMTPTGVVWDVGEVRAGNADFPRAFAPVQAPHGQRWDVDAAENGVR